MRGRISGFVLLVLLSAILVPFVSAQMRRSGSSVKQVVPYNSHFAFTRLFFGSGLGGFGFGGAAWSHDYPAADKNVSALLDYITHTRVRLDGTNILDLDEPEIFDNPVLYVWEPGFWAIQPSEARRLRDYLLKGGFIIFDDFEGPEHWNNMVAQMREALPEHQFLPIDVRHPIFHSFFDFKAINVPHPSAGVTPGFWAIFEDNDPSKRMIALANHNSDIAEYWEWSAEGLYSEDATGDAYRLGINYFVYAMTH
jgi:hypothetical protein